MGTSNSMRALLTQTMTLRLMVRDSAGDLSVSAEYSDVPAHIEYVRKQRFTAGKELVDTVAVVFLADDAQITQSGEWRIVFDSAVMEVAAVDKVLDPRDGSLHHFEVMVR